MTNAAVRVLDLENGSTSVLFDCQTDSDEVVQQAGHVPNGYFWEGIAQLAVQTEAPHLRGRFDYDSEGSMFCAYGTDGPALGELASLLESIVNTPDRVSALIRTAAESGFVFDD